MTRPRPFLIAALASAAGSFVTACGSTSNPTASNVSWKVERTTDRKAYRVSGSATYSKGLDGWYAPKLTLMDELGCTTEVSLPDTQIADERSSGFVTATYDQQIQLPHPVARASLHVDYGEAKRFNDPTSVVDTPVYDQEQVVDASVRPPSEPAAGCAARAKAARRREGKAADTGDGLDRLPRNRLVALAINSAGFLCARVTDLYPDSAGQIIAHCVKYRTGRGRATYRIDADGATVEEVD